jgi:hypothetical protein
MVKLDRNKMLGLWVAATPDEVSKGREISPERTTDSIPNKLAFAFDGSSR